MLKSSSVSSPNSKFPKLSKKKYWVAWFPIIFVWIKTLINIFGQHSSHHLSLNFCVYLQTFSSLCMNACWQHFFVWLKHNFVHLKVQLYLRTMSSQMQFREFSIDILFSYLNTFFEDRSVFYNREGEWGIYSVFMVIKTM